tara:strand:+ start:566 stop:1345 length:780 start_codon:yes stop_codon:yes gene_type:complete
MDPQQQMLLDALGGQGASKEPQPVPEQATANASGLTPAALAALFLTPSMSYNDPNSFDNRYHPNAQEEAKNPNKRSIMQYDARLAEPLPKGIGPGQNVGSVTASYDPKKRNIHIDAFGSGYTGLQAGSNAPVGVDMRKAKNVNDLAHMLGTKNMISAVRDLQQKYPWATGIDGLRISGARTNSSLETGKRIPAASEYARIALKPTASPYDVQPVLQAHKINEVNRLLNATPGATPSNVSQTMQPNTSFGAPGQRLTDLW